MRQTLAFVLASSLITTVAAPAIAQRDDARCAGTSNDGRDGAGTTYCFGSENVRGSLVGSSGQSVQALRHPRGVTLIQMRAHFVHEMLKSVENL